MESSRNKIVYDVSMGILALIVIAILIIETSFKLSDSVSNILIQVDSGIWVIFFFDYFIRLYRSKEKLKFVKNNKADLISIIPFNSLFKALRVFKVIRVFKIAKISKVAKLVKLAAVLNRFKNKVNIFIKTNNFNHVMSITVSIILIGSIAISLVENMSFGDSLWWSFVTTTTVGYGDISPSTNVGRIIAAILMIVGIGFIGMLTGTIATYFLDGRKKDKVSYKDSIIDGAIIKLNDFDNLSKAELRDLFKVLDSLKD